MRGLKSVQFQNRLKLGRFEIASFSYLGYFRISLKSPGFQNKPFWRILSLGAIKYIRNLKKLARTSFWCLYGRFRLLRDYLKWNHDDFFGYKIKKRRPRASWQNHQERGRPVVSRRPGRSPWKEVNRQVRKLQTALNLTDQQPLLWMRVVYHSVHRLWQCSLLRN